MADAEHRHDEIQGQIIHVYDGIEEADNELPRWWLATFIGAIIFAFGYWFYYHEYHVGPLPNEEYAQAVAAAAAAGGEISAEVIETLARSETEVAAGQALFSAHCAVCHGDQAQGNIGPNLTDAYWIHGAAPTEIFAVIRDGAGDQGMPAWGSALGPQAVQRLAAFVLSVRGSNLPGKEPQGELATGF